MHNDQAVEPFVLIEGKSNEAISATEIKRPCGEPRRWLTLEFAAYYAIILQALYYGMRSVYRFSSPSDPSYSRYQSFLSEGWVPERQIDLSDRQYGSFRKSLAGLSALMAAYLAVSYVIRRRNADIIFRSYVGLIFVFVLHGFNVLKILLIVGVNYLITKSAGARYKPFLLWSWALLVLFVTEWLEFPFFPTSLFTGSYKRWNIVFKITVLRMISFGMDYHWFAQPTNTEQILQHKLSCKDGCTLVDDCERSASQFGCTQVGDFDWPQYMAYLFYPPLFLAGPILTFNSFMYQVKRPWTSKQNTAHYALRMLSCFLLLDILLHYCYAVAIKESKAFEHLSATGFGMLGFFNLKIIWLKLLVIWRYFRTIAMLDGFNPPENMLRCMSNNFSGMAFWRSWHRSFYLWILRYVYIPLGGSSNLIWSMWPVFMFVAVWHDLRFNLLAWSWLICLFFLPEILGRWLSERWKMKEWRNYRLIAGTAATGSICTMMVANLVGFAVGLDGIKVFLQQILTFNGMAFVLDALCTIFAATQIMFEVRAEERRHGCFNNY